ncbi:MAG: lysine--tRNA ligase [Bdellovibrionaceae bacterium]|nr:lysine--tRNA ligase [Pseudobdellovibrionaceae bacterium]
MSKENPLRLEKTRKLQELRSLGIDPFPHNYKKTHNAADLKSKDAEFEPGDVKEELTAKLAGRLMTKRPMGKAAFFNLQDQTGSFQSYVQVSELSETAQKSFKLMDIGDIIGVEGYMFKTRKGEMSLHVKDLQILCKTLEPLPEKYHGVADVEIKYRQRYLDLIMSPETRNVFEARSKIIRAFRTYLDNKGFLEVETPVLQPIYGGAAAYPFSTHHRALDMKLFLKISPELYLKRLIVGGFEKVYEIGKNFRNEGIDRSHNPEFTMLEYYEAYTDYIDQMKQFEEVIAFVAKEVTGSTKVVYQDKELDFTPPWERISVYDAIKKYGDFDVESAPAEDIIAEIKKYDPKFDAKDVPSKGHLIMELFDHTVEPKIVQPTFITDFPVEISPLTKSHRSKPGLVERFEPICAGMEIGNSYTELNDPEDQRARLKEQEAQRVVDEEAQPMDEDFLNAIDVGMPPTGGVGIGIERIVMLLTNQHSIRDILFFPTMKPRG